MQDRDSNLIRYLAKDTDKDGFDPKSYCYKVIRKGNAVCKKDSTDRKSCRFIKRFGGNETRNEDNIDVQSYLCSLRSARLKTSGRIHNSDETDIEPLPTSEFYTGGATQIPLLHAVPNRKLRRLKDKDLKMITKTHGEPTTVVDELGQSEQDEISPPKFKGLLNTLGKLGPDTFGRNISKLHEQVVEDEPEHSKASLDNPRSIDLSDIPSGDHEASLDGNKKFNIPFRLKISEGRKDINVHPKSPSGQNKLQKREGDSIKKGKRQGRRTIVSSKDSEEDKRRGVPDTPSRDGRAPKDLIDNRNGRDTATDGRPEGGKMGGLRQDSLSKKMAYKVGAHKTSTDGRARGGKTGKMSQDVSSDIGGDEDGANRTPKKIPRKSEVGKEDSEGKEKFSGTPRNKSLDAKRNRLGTHEMGDEVFVNATLQNKVMHDQNNRYSDDPKGDPRRARPVPRFGDRVKKKGLKDRNRGSDEDKNKRQSDSDSQSKKLDENSVLNKKLGRSSIESWESLRNTYPQHARKTLTGTLPHHLAGPIDANWPSVEIHGHPPSTSTRSDIVEHKYLLKSTYFKHIF